MIDELSRGTVESRGQFTVDRQKALEKLRHYLWQQPELYLLKLVQAARLSGAREILVTAGPRTVELSYDSDLEGFQDVECLERAALGAAENELNLLSAGVQGALGTGPAELQLECGSLLYRWRTSKGWQVQTSRGRGRVVFRLRRSLKGRMGGWLRDLADEDLTDLLRGRARPPAELTLLAERCPFLNTCLVLNGQPLRPGFPRRHSRLAETEWSTHLQLRAREVHIPDINSDIDWWPPRTAGDGLVVLDTGALLGHKHRAFGRWLAAVLRYHMETGHPSLVAFVKHGVVIDYHPGVLETPGLTAVVPARGLTTDVSGLLVVKDQKYEQLLRWIDRTAAEKLKKI